MQFINHLTLNTGELEKDYLDDLKKLPENTYETFDKLIYDSQTENGAPFWDDTIFKLTIDTNAYIGTLFGKIKNELCPLITTGGTDDASSDLFQIMIESGVKKLNAPIPDIPYILDRMDLIPLQYMKILKWSKNFSSTLGWMIMEDPILIKKILS